ncbi:MAG: flagellar motor protein MotB [Gammaproteobacteria bacterium]|nr:flagellar motor protein MotB [Gammaproteobacteria bacterium]
MADSDSIIVKKIIKGGHGHHGGAWKVAFADFVTAMMAFFLLLWLMGSTSPEQKEAISDYFQNPSAVQGPGGASTSMIKLGAADHETQRKSDHKSQNQDEGGGSSSRSQSIEDSERDAVKERQRLELLKQDLESAISVSEALKDFKDQLKLDITSEGLRIQIVDKKNRPMFSSGSSHLQGYTTKILEEIAKIIDKVPNKISLTGHTDATPFNNMRGYTNWELSADRANASRRALVRGGLSESKIAKVVGLSSTILYDKESPKSPVNRRISMIVMNKQTENALLQESQVESAAEAGSLLLNKGLSLPKKPLPASFDNTQPSPARRLLSPRPLGEKSPPLRASQKSTAVRLKSPKTSEPALLGK